MNYKIIIRNYLRPKVCFCKKIPNNYTLKIFCDIAKKYYSEIRTDFIIFFLIFYLKYNLFLIKLCNNNNL